jgi:hypothetical protein
MAAAPRPFDVLGSSATRALTGRSIVPGRDEPPHDPHLSLMADAPVAHRFRPALPSLLHALWLLRRLRYWSNPHRYLGRPYVRHLSRHAAAG